MSREILHRALIVSKLRVYPQQDTEIGETFSSGTTYWGS